MIILDNEYFSFYLKKVEEVMRQLIRRIHTELKHSMVEGITGSQFFVLKTIYEQKRLTASIVAEDLGVSLSAVTMVVDKLTKAGFVHRVRDEGDRRLVWLTVTSKGEEILKICLARRDQVLKKYFKQLPQEDLEQLGRIYEKLLVILQKEEIKKSYKIK